MNIKNGESNTFQLLSDYIEANYRCIDRKQLFEMFHYNKNYFYEILKKHTGMTFVQYIQNVRLEKAAAFLCRTNFSIRKISELVGYSNTTYFYRIFEKKYKLTPKEYRRMHGGKN